MTSSIVTHCSSQYLWMIPITMCIDTYIMTTLVEMFSIPVGNSYCFVYGHSSTSFFGHSITLVFGIHISLREITTGEIKMGSIHGDQLGEKHIIYL